MSYNPVVLSTSPRAYWPLGDSVLPTAREVVNGWHGVYTNIVLGGVGYPSGHAAQFLTANAGRKIGFYTAALGTAFSKTQGTLMVWFWPPDGFWTNGLQHTIMQIGSSAEFVHVQKRTTNKLRLMHYASSVPRYADIDWVWGNGPHSIMLRWNVATATFRAAIDGQLLADVGAPAAFTGGMDTGGSYWGGGPNGASPIIGNLMHAAYWSTMVSDEIVSILQEVTPMVDKASFSCTHTDYDGERSNHGFNVVHLTAANFDAQDALMDTYLGALADMVLGNRYKSGQGNFVLNNIENAAAQAAQRELKWLISYHDGTTLKSYSVELPTAKTAELDPNDRAHAHIGDAGVVDAFITAFEAYALTPDGNAPIVDEITLVGRPV